MPLKRNITRTGLYFTSIGSIIGSGWLFAPFYAAQLAGPLAIASWIIGAFIILLTAFSFIEISTKYPIAGGIVRLVQFSHGTPTSLVVSWLSWASLVLIPAIEVQASLQYCSHFFPQLILHNDDHVSLFGFTVAAVLMAIFIMINAVGIKVVTIINNYIGVWKIIIPILVSIVLILTHFNSNNFASNNIHPYPDVKHMLQSLAIGGVVFAFVGFRAVIELAGESKNPQRDIPITIILSIFTCMIMYILLQIAFIGALKPTDITNGWAQLNFTSESSPMIGLVATLALGWILTILFIDAIASPSGTSLLATTTTARVSFAMAKAGYLPAFFGKTNRSGAPVYAIIINYLVGLLFFLPFSGWQGMISFLVSTSVFAYGLGPIVLISFRLQHNHQAKFFKLPFASVLCPLIFYFSGLLMYWTGWNTIWKLIALVIIGIMVMGLSNIIKHKKYHYEHLAALLWLLGYLIGLGVISYLGSFGGKHIISFGYDFIVFAIFSVIMFKIGIHYRLKNAFILPAAAE
jgi:amino acid transporter